VLAQENQSFHAVLLAAGEGSRMGRVPKSLFRLNGDSLLLRQLLSLSAAGAEDIVIVTGYFYQAIEAEIQDAIRAKQNKLARIHLIRNPEPHRDQQSSVLLGLGAVKDFFPHVSSQTQTLGTSPVMVALADQPLMSADDYRSCITFFHNRCEERSIIYPVVGKNRGNPVVLTIETVNQVLKSGQSCKAYIEKHPELVQHFVCDNEHYIFDLDEPEDLETFYKRTGFILTLPQKL
jgi:molybdenum cofactor cytidylyltransferase